MKDSRIDERLKSFYGPGAGLAVAGYKEIKVPHSKFVPTDEKHQQIEANALAWLNANKPAAWWDPHQRHRMLQAEYEKLTEDTPAEVRHELGSEMFAARCCAKDKRHRIVKNLVGDELARLSEEYEEQQEQLGPFVEHHRAEHKDLFTAVGPDEVSIPSNDARRRNIEAALRSLLRGATPDDQARAPKLNAFLKPAEPSVVSIRDHDLWSAYHVVPDAESCYGFMGDHAYLVRSKGHAFEAPCRRHATFLTPRAARAPWPTLSGGQVRWQVRQTRARDAEGSHHAYALEWRAQAAQAPHAAVLAQARRTR